MRKGVVASNAKKKSCSKTKNLGSCEVNKREKKAGVRMGIGWPGES